MVASNRGNSEGTEDSFASEKTQQAFRRSRARLAAYAMHHKHPEIAKEAGRRGGEATVARFPLGRKAWGVAMALKRWHPKPLISRSRAPRTELDAEEGGASESGSVPAHPKNHPPLGAGLLAESPDYGNNKKPASEDVNEA